MMNGMYLLLNDEPAIITHFFEWDVPSVVLSDEWDMLSKTVINIPTLILDT